MLTNRVQFIQYEGNEILLIDASNATEKEAIDMISDFDEIIKNNEDKAPFLLLGDYAEVNFNLGIIEKFKTSSRLHRQQIKKYAAVGVSGKAKVFVSILVNNPPYELEFFDTREEGLEWLINKNS